jgi:hypothetical protein
MTDSSSKALVSLMENSETGGDERFGAWCDAAADATLAYEAWRAAPTDRRAEAYAVYIAAADREAAAADYLEHGFRS